MKNINRWKTAWVLTVLCAVTAIGSHAQTFTSLVSFDGTNGAKPQFGALAQGTDGDFYGTTYSGGANNQGTVFRVTAAGRLTTLYNFCSQANCADGANPEAGLVLGTDGNFYGTTVGGGILGQYGPGTVFRITPAGKLTTLYVFCLAGGLCSDGELPTDTLVQGTDGNFYGTTFGGGLPNSDGTIFKITPAGTLTTLYIFCALIKSCPDGALPYAGLMQAGNGNFYGTNYIDGKYGYGVVFEITPQAKFSVIYNFCSKGGNCPDGANAAAGLIQAADRNLYGTTFDGSGWGTIFKLANSGTLTNLYTFCSQPNCVDGYQPAARLVQATDGNFYSTTLLGGTTRCFNNDSCGTIFEFSPGGTLTTLYNFCSETGCADGNWPYAGLVQGTDGNFYGETYYGGNSNNGTIFKLSTGLKPFVETVPTTAKVGANVIILGNNLTGASGVKFNGTAATFTVESATWIKTTVPSGATSGTVQVVTSGGTLTSNVTFRVLP
jgi:uncharacterized repeat protein (TIGR03803 family)